MEKLTADQLKSELQTLVQRIVDEEDYALEDTDRAIKSLRSLEDLKLTASLESGASADDDDIPAEYRCSITDKLMKNPVLMDSGETYDRGSVDESDQQHLTPNMLVKELILKWLKETTISLPEKKILLELLTRLSSSDIDDQKMAAKEIKERSSSSEIIRSLFGKIPDAIPKMIKALSDNNDLDVEEDSITALLHISTLEGNKKLLAEAIPVIIKSLKSENDLTRSMAAVTLSSLAVLEPNKRKIGEAGALNPLIELVDEAHDEVMKDAAAAFFSLCTLPENRSLAVEHGAVAVIVQKIRDEKLVDTLLSGLAFLCSQGDGVKEMVEADAVSLLFDILKADGSHERNKMNALAVISSICSVDSAYMRDVDKHETRTRIVYRIAHQGTSRLQTEAYALLEKVIEWNLYNMPLFSAP